LRLIQNTILAVTVFCVAASNVRWRWTNDYAASALALAAGFALSALAGNAFAASRIGMPDLQKPPLGPKTTLVQVISGLTALAIYMLCMGIVATSILRSEHFTW
jgi:hypothetical protein